MSWLKIIKNLLNNKKLRNKKIVLLPHVLKPERVDDRIVIREIKNRLSEKENERLIFLEKEILPSEARFILGNGLFTITGRMHAAISTFQMGKPALSLSYSVKYAGIIGKDLERQDLIIEAKGEELWKSNTIVNLTKDKVDYILDNYPPLIKEINRKAKYLKSKALSQIKDITNKLKDGKK